MMFQEGDYIKSSYSREYYSQCISMKELFKNLRVGDEILTYRTGDVLNSNIVKKITFDGYGNCEYMGNIGNEKCCVYCKGYLKNNEKIICPGYTQDELSCVLKIIKNNFIPLLEKDMFKI